LLPVDEEGVEEEGGGRRRGEGGGGDADLRIWASLPRDSVHR